MGAAARLASSSAPENPYLSARREWNERYGDYLAQARVWRLFALGLLAVVLVLSGGIVWLAKRSHVVPYVVEVDRLGANAAVRRAEQAAPADARIVRWQLIQWLTAARSVYADAAANRQALETVYWGVAARSDAYAALRAIHEAQLPSKRAETELVTVEVRSVLPITGNTWRVEWSETVRGRDGRAPTTAPWQATVSLAVAPPTDEAVLLHNPLGIYVTQVNWQKRLPGGE